MTRDPYGLAKLRRAFEDSQNRTGMVVGLPKVTIDSSHVAHALAYVDALRTALTEAQAAATFNANMLADANAALEAARLSATARDEALASIRVFAQDCIENGYFCKGSLGNLYGIRDLCDLNSTVKEELK